MDAALASFAYSRPQGIHHEVFLEELQTRYKCLPTPPIPLFCSANAYNEFYRSNSGGEKQIQDLHAAAGWPRGAWAAHIVKGRYLEVDGAGGMPDASGVQTATIATNGSHNDLEGMLG